MARKNRAETPNTISRLDYVKIATELEQAQREVTKAVEAQAAARGRVAGIMKRFEGLGGDKAVLRFLRDMAKLDDHERQKFMETLYDYAGFEELPLVRAGTDEVPQGEMFPAEVQEANQGLRDARVYNDGFNSGKQGGTPEHNPHEAGSRDHQTWARAFGDGLEEKNTAGAQTPKQATVRKRDPRSRAKPPEAAPEAADDIGETVGTA